MAGTSDDTTGQAVVAFLILAQSALAKIAADLAPALRRWVSDPISPIARPSDLYIVGELPKTRSGKIMRRLVRDIAKGRDVGDTTTLADTG